MLTGFGLTCTDFLPVSVRTYSQCVGYKSYMACDERLLINSVWWELNFFYVNYFLLCISVDGHSKKSTSAPLWAWSQPTWVSANQSAPTPASIPFKLSTVETHGLCGGSMTDSLESVQLIGIDRQPLRMRMMWSLLLQNGHLETAWLPRSCVCVWPTYTHQFCPLQIRIIIMASIHCFQSGFWGINARW